MDAGQKVTEAEAAAILAVASKAIEFGRACAAPLGEDALQDPVLNTYFLIFVFGAVEWLGDNMDADHPLSYPQKLASMAEALARFGTSDRETVRGTVLMVHEAADAPALRVRAAGGDAMRRWHRDGDQDALSVFVALRDEPNALPLVDEQGRPDQNRTTH